MSHNIHNPQGGGNCQVPCNVDHSVPVQPSAGALWNLPRGRRTFLKQTGGATLATALALHGTRIQLQAAETGRYYNNSTQTETATFIWKSSQNDKPSDATISGTTQILQWTGPILKAWFSSNVPGNPPTTTTPQKSGGAVWENDSSYGHGGYWKCTVTKTTTWHWGP
jgi:hypothetical protein